MTPIHTGAGHFPMRNAAAPFKMRAHCTDRTGASQQERKCPTSVRVKQGGSVLEGEAERTPVLAPGEELLGAERPALDPQGLGGSDRGPVGNTAAEIGPRRGDLQLGLEAAAGPGGAPGAPPGARQ